MQSSSEQPEAQSKTVRFHDWVLQCDVEATRRAYAAVLKGGPEDCGCCYCRNFQSAWQLVFPDEFLSLLDDLGIDAAKPVEVCDYPGSVGLRRFDGWFHFVGSIAAHPPTEPRDLQPMDPVAARLPEAPPVSATALVDRRGRPFSVRFSHRADLAASPFEGLQVSQLDFSGSIPWVLAEPQPEG